MNLSTTSPLSFQEWSKEQSNFVEISQQKYLQYLNSWYDYNNSKKVLENQSNSKREEYIQLIKDLTFLFNADERDLFLSQIDFSNEEDLIYVIPYLAHKLKDITQILNAKRDSLKNSKTKHGLIGSNLALEEILYEYVLNNYTKKEYSYTKVPVSPLVNFFPELSSVNKNFFIEIEELYDDGNYHDSDPSISISEYLNSSELMDAYPFQDLSLDEINDLISTRYLPRVAPTPLSKIFNQYLTTISTASTVSLSSYYNSQVNNLITGSQKYLGESIYGLTAIKVEETNIPDYILNIGIEQGNNWFYWPSGDKNTNDSLAENTFYPIEINSSNLISSISSNFGQISGTSYLDSDLIFTDKNGTVEGAWLMGFRKENVSDIMDITIESNTTKSFLYPFVGFNINSKSYSFNGYSIKDYEYGLYNSLEPVVKQNLLNSYYTSTLPNSASYDIYLNQSSLIDAGALAAKFSDEADSIRKKTNYNTINTSYVDNLSGATEEAYLFKFDRTDLPIVVGTNNIVWPVSKFDNTVDLPITLKKDTCLPIVMGQVEPNSSMVGAVAGTTFDTADVIYKATTLKEDNFTEAAWLAAGLNTQLDILKGAIDVYNGVSALDCAEYLEGPLQSSLAFKADADNYVSFIWGDVDTPADDVFYYHPHASNCPYGKSYPHNFYPNQDYQNSNPLNSNKNVFPLKKNPCTCRSVYYSPLGTEGVNVKDYNGMADYLYADPFGLGKKFGLNSWKDTRRLNVNNSPQFSFYQIDGQLDKQVGFGNGTWKTGNGEKMILKTGRRYTYYRSSLRNKGNNSTDVPYMLIYYPYKNINLIGKNIPSINNSTVINKNIDLVLLIDNSRTQTFDLDVVKELAKSICTNIINKNTDSLISVVSFAKNGIILNYLTNDLGSILKHINDIKIQEYPNFTTNILDGLTLANNIFNNVEPFNNDCGNANLCSNLSTEIFNLTNISTITNCPRSDSSKQIIIFSDGQETENVGSAVPYAQTLKEKGIQITSMDVGEISGDNNLMEIICSDGSYFNLQNYLIHSDGNIHNYIEYVSLKLMGVFPSLPTWCKAVKNSNGAWTGLPVPSDMILNPGDYLQYKHQSSILYVGSIKGFIQDAVSFALNIKLDGWDYDTNTFGETWIGDTYGAKPFWAKSYTDIDANNNFYKSTISFGGQIRILEGYVPIHQPELSTMILSNGSYVEYTNRNSDNLVWKQPLDFSVTLKDTRWNQLIISKDISNLDFTLYNGNPLDLIVDSSNEPSNIILESYSSFKPAKYNYYARNPFIYTENLYNLNICKNSFVTFVTGKVLNASEPYNNLDNINYPTVATISFPFNTKSEKQTGGYLTSDKMGTSYYRGKGYEIDIDPDSITYLNSISAERLFLNLDKYGPRNRGLTKKDQTSPVIIKDIDNRWLMKPSNAGSSSGIIIDTLKNQKLVPYQSNYEMNPNNQLGVSTQNDNVQFWDANIKWTEESKYPLNIRKELNDSTYNDRCESLLVNIGQSSYWVTDIFGNNYTLIKNNIKNFITEYGVIIITENNIPFVNEG
jgi:hypothetical protein